MDPKQDTFQLRSLMQVLRDRRNATPNCCSENGVPERTGGDSSLPRESNWPTTKIDKRSRSRGRASGRAPAPREIACLKDRLLPANVGPTRSRTFHSRVAILRYSGTKDRNQIIPTFVGPCRRSPLENRKWEKKNSPPRRRRKCY